MGFTPELVLYKKGDIINIIAIFRGIARKREPFELT